MKRIHDGKAAEAIRMPCHKLREILVRLAQRVPVKQGIWRRKEWSQDDAHIDARDIQ